MKLTRLVLRSRLARGHLGRLRRPITGQAALAIAGVVALYAPMPAANKKAVAALFKGDSLLEMPLGNDFTEGVSRFDVRAAA